MTAQPSRQSKKSIHINSSPLAMFCSRHRITLQQLSDLSGATGRTNAHRLLKNDLIQSRRGAMLARLAETLPDFLLDKGLSKAEIDRQLMEIFDEGEYKPMISQRIELTQDEQKWFGFSEDPFSGPPQSRDEVFIAPELRAIIDRVDDAIKYQGFVFVNGPIGSGKSTLRALIVDEVEQNPNLTVIWPEFFDMHNVTPMQISEAILSAFDVYARRSSVSRGTAVKQLLKRLYNEGRRIALAFDECHRLNDAAVSSLKNFLEMNSGGFQRYLGVVLFGQPIFESRLRDPRFQEIFERVVQLRMPDFTEIGAGYLKHRLALIGADVDQLFDKTALDLICRQATTPLQLGNIANQALRHTKAFNEKRVLGDLIATKMIFEKRHEPAFRQRKVG